MIPDWNIAHQLPPIDIKNPTQPNRAPYRINSLELVLRFAISMERCKILKGFFDFRRDLHSMGIAKGFQWLNGSFAENIEIKANRHPHDIDVVTFCFLPEGKQENEIAFEYPDIFKPLELKNKYYVDGYYITLGEKLDESKTRQIAYWYSMWAHDRSCNWKGFMQLPLDCAMEDEALKHLHNKIQEYKNESE